LSAVAEVARPVLPHLASRTVVVCSGSPKWVDASLKTAMDFWAKHGSSFSDPVLHLDCTSWCTDRKLPCAEGMILISLRDGQFSEEHAGETAQGLSADGKTLRWASILVPEKIYGEPEGKQLPPNVYDLVMTHELGHAEGYEHSKTKVVGGLFAEKTGEVMNAKLTDLGWGDQGL
jgi:hypothetical protein